MVDRIHGRFAADADVPLLAALNKQLIEDEGHRNPMSVPELAVRMAGWLQSEYKAVIFESEGETVGYALFRFEPEFVYLRQFFVARDRRRKGIGRGAISWCRTHAWESVARVRLDVLTNNAPGTAFWRAIGFNEYAIAMELQL